MSDECQAMWKRGERIELPTPRQTGEPGIGYSMQPTELPAHDRPGWTRTNLSAASRRIARYFEAK